MSATPSTNQTTEGVTLELGTDAYRGVTLRRGGQQIVISPPAKVIWSKMVCGTISQYGLPAGARRDQSLDLQSTLTGPLLASQERRAPFQLRRGGGPRKVRSL